LGLGTLKFFPASVAGGPAALKALGGPFKTIRFVPTGGVDLANLEHYLALPNVAAVGGSWMVPGSAVAAADWAKIAGLAAEAVSAARGIVQRKKSLDRS
jgi:2-dehydro-3-deoxyphosphogluconate aldolase/(4S)-4-hydroxy-2-oxoglutarate aldolase